MSVPELFQFQFSHYNEKARWALDYKRIPHVRRSYLPGLHIVPILRLSGQRAVPVLRDDGRVVPGSAAIVAHLEERYPDPPLHPADAAERQRALDIQQWFDDAVGAPIRRAFFFDVLPDASYAVALFTAGAGSTTKATYRALFPAIRAIMRKDMAITPEGAARGLDRAREALDFVARTAGPDGHLVGNRFTVADLAAAALLAPAVIPPEFPYQPPVPMAPAFTQWLARWSDQPGAAWVRAMYARHRGASAEVAA